MFRLGDFYEMFFEDAEVASRVLEITLTSREKGENAVPMCGVPWHAARAYVARLVESGFKVAICEQVEDPRQAKGIVRREVVQVVTPGLVSDLEAIEAKAPHYLLAVAPGKQALGFSYADATTGEFWAGEVTGWPSLADELSRLEPREVLAPEGADAVPEGVLRPGTRVTRLEPARFDLRGAREALQRHFGVAHLSGFGRY